MAKLSSLRAVWNTLLGVPPPTIPSSSRARRQISRLLERGEGASELIKFLQAEPRSWWPFLEERRGADGSAPGCRGGRRAPDSRVSLIQLLAERLVLIKSNLRL